MSALRSMRLSVTLKPDPDGGSQVIAYLNIDGEDHLTHGDDDLDALKSAVELAHLVLHLCPEHDDRKHCYCVVDARGGQDGRACCRCRTWSSADWIEQRMLVR